MHPSPCSFLLFSALDESALGRIDYSTYSHQALMELLIRRIPEAKMVQDSAGNFLDIEEWEGVNLNADGEVTKISLPFESLDGIDLQWVPPTVETIILDSGGICAELDTVLLPRTLRKMNIRNNRLYGSIKWSHLPPHIDTFIADTNCLSGTVELSAIPTSMRSLCLTANNFAGMLNFAALRAPIAIFLI